MTRYCMEAETERWKRGQTFRETYRQLTKEQFQKIGDTFKYFEHQIIQENFQKIWQDGQLGYTIQLFFGPYLTFSTYGISLSWKKFLKKNMISRSLTGHLATPPPPTPPPIKEKETSYICPFFEDRINLTHGLIATTS